jgi:uncharacterized membrane protein YjgN (DUF898 family)
MNKNTLESKFTGGLLGLIGINILGFIITSITLGIGAPWAIVMKQSWYVKHTIIDGHKLTFDGTGGQLFGSYIKWFLLTIITLLIYGLWLPIKIKQWTTKHTHIEEV